MSGAILIALAAGAAGAAGVVDLAGAWGARRAERGRRPAGARAVPRARIVARRLLRGLAWLGAAAGRRPPSPTLEARLQAAGRPLGLSLPDLMAVKAGGALFALLAGSPAALALPGRLPAVALIALPALGFLAPDVALSRRATRRARRMQAQLPDMLDLLRIAVDAGLGLDRALEEVARRHAGELAAEWRAAADQVRLGVPRRVALRRLVARAPAPGMAAVVAALERAERHGAPIADTLAAQAREARAERARRIRDHAARAAPKIQLVVALLLVPSVLLLVAAAIVSGVG